VIKACYIIRLCKINSYEKKEHYPFEFIRESLMTKKKKLGKKGINFIVRGSRFVLKVVSRDISIPEAYGKIVTKLFKKFGFGSIREFAAKEAFYKKKHERALAAKKEVALKSLRLMQEFDKVPVFRYGSHVAGRADWQEKWDKSPGRRILFYALKDYSGSFFKWAEAVNQCTDYAARLVVMNVHQYGYENDLIMPYPDTLDRSDLGSLAEEADIIHIKDETGFFDGTNRLPSDIFKMNNRPIVFTAYGGYMRKYKSDPEFKKYVLGFDARIAMTPDLIYDWFDGYFVPHAINTEIYPYTWRDGKTLSHSPSTKARKGTDDLLSAIKGLELEFNMIHGVTHEECLERKQASNLFFDQAGTEVAEKMGNSTVIGWYGNSALEAAVYGIPTIAHLSDHAFEGARRAGRDIQDQCAIMNTALGSEGIRETIGSFLKMSPAERLNLSKRTRDWMVNFHSYEACAKELSRVYDKLLTK